MNWPALAALAVVVLVGVGLHRLRRRRLNFSVVTLVALAAGIPIGLVAGENVEYIDPIGKIYLNILLACVAPLVLVAIVSSVTSLGTLEKLRSIGARSIFWLLLSNALAVVLALGLGLLAQPGSGVHAELGSASTSVIENSVQDFSQVVISFFPTNLVENLRSNDIIPIILVAVVLSVAYLALAARRPEAVRSFRDGAEALKLVVFKAVGYVIRLTPYAIVALTATTVGESANLGGQFWSLLGLLALVWLACFLHAFVINGVLLRTFADVSPLAFFRKVFPAQLTAFTTQSSVGTLPVTTSRLTSSIGVHPEIAHFAAPLGTTIGMPGCSGIWPVLVAVWGINAYDITYSLVDYAILAVLGVVVSIGTAGVPGTATVAAATVFAAAGLPLEFVAVTIPISTIADMARTMTNVTAASVSATIVARQTRLLDDAVFARDASDDAAAGGAVTRDAAAEAETDDAPLGELGGAGLAASAAPEEDHGLVPAGVSAR
ncbi:MAG: dicarboxylate/amino acid:cation symporter [Microbacteriaceae bacterium]